MDECFIKYVENSVKVNWDKPALTDYKGVTYTYKDVARKIEKLHILFAESGVAKGDKIALCGKNSSNWGVVFMATITYGAVAVPILSEFSPENINNIVKHSQAKLLFVADGNWETIKGCLFDDLAGVIRMEDYSIRISNYKGLDDARATLNEKFGRKYPSCFTADDVCYDKDSLDSLAMINYTSGSTGQSKGVMLPYRSLWANMKFAVDALGWKPGERMVSILPMAHMYGLAFEFLYEFTSGMHVFFLTKTPSPKIIAEAFSEIKPKFVIAVPLVIEKIVRKNVFPLLEKTHMKVLMSIPLINTKIKDTIRQKLVDAFGGEFEEVIVGGAALNKDVEAFLKSIKFPFTVGYGMTECGPILAYDDWKTYKEGSCGKAALGMELKIDSCDSENVVGEIIAKGDCLMKGYYRNQEATDLAIDANGWLHTGDLGVIDSDGYLFIRGRIKNMILGPSGQNIYPEEIEDKLNNLLYVGEAVVVERSGRLVALVYPDQEQVEANQPVNVEDIINEDVMLLNKDLPAYSKIAFVEIQNEEFEKTPKRSIKRYLYK